VEQVTISPQMRRQHIAACKRIKMSMGWWTSHTVIVVDQSGSMRKTDVAGGVTRSDAVWVTLALDFIAKRIENGEAKETDVVSIVCMHSDSSVLVGKYPTDWVLYNKIIDLLRSCIPHFDGNYLPGLDVAERLLHSNTNAGCALLLFFLSDGKPSDKLPKGIASSGSAKLHGIVQQRIDRLASSFGRRLTVSTVGFADPGQDFSILELIATRSAQFGSVGKFHGANLSAESLSMAFASLSTSLTATKLELSDSDHTAFRQVRDVRREARDTADDDSLSGEWYQYHGGSRLKYSVKDRDWLESAFQTPNSVGVAFRKCYFGEGAERLVRKFREFDSYKRFVGPLLVAKEGRFQIDIGIQREDRVNFHRKFCETQIRAQELAIEFNKRLAVLPSVNDSIPRVSFLDCSVYIINDVNLGDVGVLVEKQLDQSRYKKWNDNCGFVDGQASGLEVNVGDALEAIVEDDEDEDDEEEEPSALFPKPLTVQAADIPQAFSHFTYRYTRRKMLVCDLQGVLSAPLSTETPLFEFTDPVMHYWSHTGRKNVFGRTDRGKKGIHDFFKTHECSDLCRMLNKRWVHRAAKA